jgi:uncharacterized Zn-binding protein involved in type VI secretion
MRATTPPPTSIRPRAEWRSASAPIGSVVRAMPRITADTVSDAAEGDTANCASRIGRTGCVI